ncbi:MAG: hypothetical protein ACRD19_07295 [Terriglobia bacterium]
MSRKRVRSTVELDCLVRLWESKAEEIAEAAGEFLQFFARLKRARRGSERYSDLAAELVVLAGVFEAKGRSLTEIDYELIDAMPDD